MSRKRFLTGLAVVCSALLLLLLLSRSRRDLTDQPSSGANPAGKAQPRLGTNQQSLAALHRPNTAFASNIADTSKTNPTLAETLERLPGYSLRTPIEFFGMVTDERGSPVSKASVEFGWVDDSPSNYSKRTVESGDDGHFSLTGVRGKSLDVQVRKEGYYTSRQRNQSAFEYSDSMKPNFHRPNRASPVIFHLKKKGTPEVLVSHKKSLPLSRDGMPSHIDFATGATDGSGSHAISIQCWTSQKNKETGRFDWQFAITVPGGGLVVTTNEFDFQAPDTGYSPEHVGVMSGKEPVGWSVMAERNAFFRFADGTFGRAKVTIIPYGDHFAKVDLKYNPTGSKNLEYDPAVQPKQ